MNIVRHGAGPLVTEEEELNQVLPEPYNITNSRQQQMRLGWLDLVAFRYAVDVVGGPDCLGVTFLDYFKRVRRWKTCSSYRYRGEKPVDGQLDCRDGIITAIRKKTDLGNLDHQERITQALLDSTPILSGHVGGEEEYLRMIESKLGAPVKLTSSGPTFREKVWL